MPQISPTEFLALPLRVHTFLADVPLHDVWAVDLPMHRDGVTLSEFLRRTSQGGINRLPPVAHALIRLRLFLGRIFRLEADCPKNVLWDPCLRFSRKPCGLPVPRCNGYRGKALSVDSNRRFAS